jgi:predicted SprT family Zn-dependent metalloprotease
MGDDGVREVLLHEMCHAAVYRNSRSSPRDDPHGQQFVTELRRLAAFGEVWADEQAEYYLTVQQTNFPLDAWRLARSA